MLTLFTKINVPIMDIKHMNIGVITIIACDLCITHPYLSSRYMNERHGASHPSSNAPVLIFQYFMYFHVENATEMKLTFFNKYQVKCYFID